MFKIKIYDVDHGNCAYLVLPSGESILIDASHHRDGYYPRHEIKADLMSRGYECVSIYVNSNADSDHVSDLQGVRDDLSPIALLKGDIDSTKIRQIKEKPLTEGLEALCRIMDDYNGPPPEIDFGGVEMLTFRHPFEAFGDTNNASVVTFYFYGNFGIIFPGDLEKAGWEKFLSNPDFVAALKRVNIFVASHHGREGGYCDAIFAHFKPDLVIISDKPIEHDTQDHDLYGKHSNGISLACGPRKVVSTRSDGSVLFEVDPDGSFSCHLNV